jgi:Protein of unknown function (DUF2934)
MNSITPSTIAKTRPPEPMLEHEIRLRAYDLYQQRGRMDGHALDDWLQAEAEVLDLTGLLYLAEPSGVQNGNPGSDEVGQESVALRRPQESCASAHESLGD